MKNTSYRGGGGPRGLFILQGLRLPQWMLVLLLLFVFYGGTAVWQAAPALAVASMVVGGGRHTLALLDDGSLWAWGCNQYGQLGDGTTGDKHGPVRVPGLTGMVAVAAGTDHSLALDEQGRVYAWGANVTGQLGTGTTDQDPHPVPSLVPNLEGVVAIAASGNLSVALKSDGTVWAWGAAYGAAPQQVTGLGGVKAVAVGTSYMGDYLLAVDGMGRVWALTLMAQVPMEVPGLDGVTAVAAGGQQCLVLKQDGTVWSFPSPGSYGIPNLGGTVAAKVYGLEEIAAVAAGYSHNLACDREGRVWAWGGNQYGQLGDGTIRDRETPAQIGGLWGVHGIAAGDHHSLAWDGSGAVWAWGWNEYGQLGDGTTQDRHEPVVVPGLHLVVSRDTTPPTVANLTPQAGSRVSEPRPLIGAVVQDNTAVDAARIVLELDGTLVPPTYQPTSGQVSYQPQADLAPGEHTVRLTVYDVAGNATETRWSFSVTLPLPVVVLEAPSSPTNAASVNLTGAVTVDGAPANGATVRVYVARDGAPPTTAGEATADETGRFVLQVPLEQEGNYTFTGVALCQGRQGPESEPVILEVDRTPPDAPILSVEARHERGELVLSWASPQARDVVAYLVYLGQEEVTVLGAGTTGHTLSGLTPGTYTVAVRARDRAGNLSPPAEVRAELRDVTPPSAPANLRATLLASGRALLEWEVAKDNVAVAGYRVYRAETGAQPVVVAVVYEGTRWEDCDLAAGTAYTYAVTAFDAAANESPPSDRATVTTPPLSIADFSWQAPQSREGLLLAGSRLDLLLSADSGRAAVARVVYNWWYGDNGAVLEQPVERAAEVLLSEDPSRPGTYRGAFPLAEGTAEVKAVRAALSDGRSSVYREATGLPRTVAGLLRVKVVGAEGLDLSGSSLVVWSAAQKSGTTTKVDRPGEYAVPALPPAGDYAVRLLRFGRLLVEAGPFEVRPGLATPFSLIPPQPTTFRVRVLAPDRSPVAHASVALEVPGSGYYRYLWTGVEGWTPTVEDLRAGDTVRVWVTVTGPYRQPEPRTVTLREGPNEVEVRLEALPRVDVTGRVVGTRGEPVPGVRVTATQSFGGVRYSTFAETDANGCYHLSLLEDRARVRAASPVPRWLAPEEYVWEITRDTTTLPELMVDTLEPARLSVFVATREVDGDWTDPVELSTPQLAREYGLRVTDEVGLEYAASSPVIFPARAGERVRVSVNHARFGSASQEVTLDDQRRGTVVFRLEEKGRLRALVRPEGASRGWHGAWQALLWKREAQGEWRPAGRATGYGERLEISVPETGHYLLEVRTTDRRYLTRREVEVPVGARVELGEVVLAPASGWFEGRPGNALMATPQEVAAGVHVSLRLHFWNAGDLTGPGEGARNAEVWLEVPAGTRLVDDSVLYNGSPAEGRYEAPWYRLSVGDVPPYRGGTVHYRLWVDPARAGNELLIRTRICYQRGDERVTEEAGRVRVRVVREVTVEGPRRLTSLQAAFSGRAPAGATVRLYDGYVFLGEAVASAAGVWSAAVTLPDTGAPAWHSLHAVAEHEGRQLASAPLAVLYDPWQPQVEVTLRHGGQVRTFRPNDGVARLFLRLAQHMITAEGARFGPGQTGAASYLPILPVDVELQFDPPDSVYDVVVLFDGPGGGEVSAHRGDDGVYRARWYPSGVPGDLYLRYRTRFSLQQVRQRLVALTSAGENPQLARGDTGDTPILPWWAQDYQVVSLTSDKDKGEARMTITLPHLGNVSLTFEMQVKHGLSYTPTPEDQERIGQTGIPAYGFSWSLREGIMETSFYVPAEVLGAAKFGAPLYLAALGLPGEAGAVIRSLTAAAGGWIQINTVLKYGFDLFDLGNNIWGLVGRYDLQEQWEEMWDRAGRLCNPEYARFIHDSLLRWQIVLIGAEFQKTFLGIACTLLGPETFGLSYVAFFIAQQIYGKFMDYLVEANLKDNDDMLTHYEHMCDIGVDGEPPPGDGDSSGRPGAGYGRPGGGYGMGAAVTWLVDPSGYVYEAVPQNRLPGVTATCWQQTEGGWVVWQAEEFGQVNPQTTDDQGCYGWDVPPGEWRVSYEKEGYLLKFTEGMEVPPPRFDVNVGLISLVPPRVQEVRAVLPAEGPGFVEVLFDKYMLADTLRGTLVILTAADGTAVDGETVPGETVETPEGDRLSRAARFVPAAPLEAGEIYTLAVRGGAASYAGVPAEEYTGTVLVPARDASGPVVAGRQPADNSYVPTSLPEITAAVSDDASGVDPGALSATVDGSAAACIWDATEGRLTVLPGVPLADGPHTVSLVVYDRAGNRSTAQWHFTVDTTVPRLMVSVEPANLTGPGAVILTVVASEPLVGAPRVVVLREDCPVCRGQEVPVSASGSNTWRGRYDVPAGVPAATFTVRVRGTDLAGNTGRGVAGFTLQMPQRPTAGGGGGALSSTEWKELRPLPSARGVLEIPGRVRLEVPADGVVGPSPVLRLRTAPDSAVAGLGLKLLSPVVEVVLEGGVLAREVTLTLWYDSRLLGAGEKPAAFRCAGPGRAWERLPSAVDAQRGTVTVHLRHLSLFTVCAVAEEARPFADIAGHWAAKVIGDLTEKAILTGYPDGTFKPENPVTRAEAAALLVRALASAPATRQDLLELSRKMADASEIPPWAQGVAAVSVREGLVRGDLVDGKLYFAGKRIITRLEMALLLVRALRQKGAEPTPEQLPFADAGEVPVWAKDELALAVGAGLIKGYPEGTLRPGQSVTRAEAAVMIARLLERLPG